MKDKDTKIKEAKERQELYDKLTIKEKLDKLDNKYGPNIGAKKQRYKLKNLLTDKPNSKKNDKKRMGRNKK